MKRILAIDFGSKRIGTAISDPLGITAQPLETIQNIGEQAVVERLSAIVTEYEVRLIVLGIPRNMDGSEGPAALAVRSFQDLLSQQLRLPIELLDERLTSVIAEKSMIQGNVRRRKRRRIKDQIEAVILLQDYLDKQST